jgi:hypothetical protein
MTRIQNTGLPNQPQEETVQPEIDPALQRLFQQKQTTNPFLGKGSMLQFSYLYWQHDPRPLIIVTDVKYGNRIRGINIHYLSFNQIKKILQQGCGNKGFSYRSFATPTQATPQQKKANSFTNAFRSYKWNGIRTIKQLDCDFIIRIMEMVRSFDPAEVEIIRKQVQEQLQRQVNTTAAQAKEPVAPAGQQVLPATLPIPPKTGV